MQPPPSSPHNNGRRGRRVDPCEPPSGRRQSSHNESDGGGLGAALLIGAGLLVVAGVSALLGWSAGRESEVETASYYTLPPRDSCGSTTEDGGGDDGRPKCVVCRDLPQRFMFVQCKHICLCEPCLVHMGRDYEDTKLHGRFDGPVKLACPVCRQLGYVVKTYAA